MPENHPNLPLEYEDMNEDQPVIPDQQREVERHDQRQDEFNFRVPFINMHVDSKGWPAVIAAVGAVGITAYASYKVCNNERFGDLLVKGFSGNSVNIHFVAESEESATRLLELLFSGDLLRLMNEELDKYLEGEELKNDCFDTVKLIHYEFQNVSKKELDSLRKSTSKLREFCDNQFRKAKRTPREAQQLLQAVADCVPLLPIQAMHASLQPSKNKQQATIINPPESLPLADTEEEGINAEKNRQVQDSLEEKQKDTSALEDAASLILDKKFAEVFDIRKDPTALLLACIVQYYKALVVAKKYRELSDVTIKLFNLIQEKISTSAEEVRSFAQRLHEKKMHVEGIFFYTASLILHKKNKLPNGAKGMADCVEGLKDISVVLMDSDDSSEVTKFKWFIKEYVVKLMCDILRDLAPTKDKDLLERCLSDIDKVRSLIEDWDLQRNKYRVLRDTRITNTKNLRQINMYIPT